MGGILGGGNQPEKLFGVKVNSSELGKPVTVVMGCAKTNQQIFWVDGFASKKQSKKAGGGKGGGKSGQYLYSADVVCGLSAGPILGIGDIWTGQSWLGSPKKNESYTIAGPSYTYTPTNAAALMNDYGVTPASTYSGTHSDYSAPGTTTVSNTTSIPFTKVAYGTTLTAGTYSVNPATGVYYFYSSDAGKTVQVNYSYLLTTINNTETDLIPSGKTITLPIPSSSTFSADLGVVYSGSYLTDTALTLVNSTPTVAGTYQRVGNNPPVYHFATADIAQQVTITFQITDPDAVGQNESTMLDFTLATGVIGQTPYSFLTGSYPGAAMGYSGIATVLYEPMDLGAAGEVQQNSFEVITPDCYGGNYADNTPILDCNVVHCIQRVLTDTQWGLGVGAIPLPASFLDNGTGGTWGSPGTPSVQQVGPTAWNWSAANSFFISPVLDSADTADSTMSKWLEAACLASFVSEGLLKLVPYGDTTVAANGCTWTAPSTYIVALDDTNFIAKDGEDPVKIKRANWQDAYNEVQVQWESRLTQYSKEITEESDQSLINRFGSRIEDPQDYSFIHTLSAATFAANMRLKRGTYIRNTYEFTLPFTYSYLEPMDLVTLTTSSVWAQGINNTNLGITNLPVRITKIVDDPIAGLKIEAEDYPFGAGAATLFNKGQSSSEVVSNAYADPGTSEVVLFEASGRLVGYGGNQLWIGATGTGDTYGSTVVWVSQDNVNYVQVAEITEQACIGNLTAILPVGSDPDTTNSIVVQLAENSPSLSSGTTGAADSDSMLVYVDGEVISYSAAAVTAQNTWTLGTYLRRGQLGTPIASHAINSLFMRLDGTIFKYTYDPTWQGKTIYLKFQAVNSFGNNPQPLSNLSAVSFTLDAVNNGALDASTGIITANNGSSLLLNSNLVAGTVGWICGTGWTIIENTGFNSSPFVARFTGTTQAITNAQHIPCAVGGVISAAAYCEGATGCNGAATVRVNFYQQNGTFIATSTGNAVSANSWTQSRVVATAPSNTGYATVDFAVIGSTAGPWYVGGFSAALQPSTLTEVPYGAVSTSGGVHILDTSGNIILKNISQMPSSAGAALGTTFADLPSLTAALLAYTLKGNPCLAGVSLDFYSSTSGGAVTNIGYTPTTATAPNGTSGTPSFSISIAGDGGGAYASITGSTSLSGSTLTWTPNLTFGGGSGYSYANTTITVTIPAGWTYGGSGSGVYSCTVSTPVAVANVPLSLQLLMDGAVLQAPTQVTTDVNGRASFSSLHLYSIAAGAHTFEVQAKRDTGTAVSFVDGSFTLIELG